MKSTLTSPPVDGWEWSTGYTGASYGLLFGDNNDIFASF